MINMLTVDVEDWYHSTMLRIPVVQWPDLDKGEVVTNTWTLLELFAKYQAKATFFVLGHVAEKYPQLVKDIAGAGHEIASHGYYHQPVDMLTREEFRSDLTASLDRLRSITQAPINGYRAPSWSLPRDKDLVYNELIQAGLVYDSSCFPPLLGQTADKKIVRVMEGLWEVPLSVMGWGKLSVPFCGGAFLRLFPLGLIRLGIDSLNRRGMAAMVHIHPWELGFNMPDLPVSWWKKSFHTWGTAKVENKLIGLLEAYRFVTVSECLNRIQAEDTEVWT